MRSPQLCSGRSPQGSLVVFTFPVAQPGPSPLRACMETQKKMRASTESAKGPHLWPHLPRASHGSSALPHILPGLPALTTGAEVCSVLPRGPASPPSLDLKSQHLPPPPPRLITSGLEAPKPEVKKLFILFTLFTPLCGLQDPHQRERSLPMSESNRLIPSSHGTWTPGRTQDYPVLHFVALPLS